MGVAPTVAPEPGHARPATTRLDGAGARRAPAAPARAAAARPGPAGPGRGAGAERVPGGGARRPPALCVAWQGLRNVWEDPRTTPDDKARFIARFRPSRGRPGEGLRLVTADFDVGKAA